MSDDSKQLIKIEDIKKEFNDCNTILAKQLDIFSKTVAPYFTVNDISAHIDSCSIQKLQSIVFFSLVSCSTEKLDNIEEQLRTKMEKLLTAIHSLGSPVIYGIVSREGITRIVFGVNYSNKDVVKSILYGLLTGIDIQEEKEIFKNEEQQYQGGFISSVPITKIDNEKQQFDPSTLMKCLNGKDYTVLVYSIPINSAQEKCSKLISVKDECFAISKRNISIQNSINDSKTITETKSQTKRGAVQELAHQIRKGKFSFSKIVDAFIEGGNKSKSEAVSTATTIEGITHGVSFEVQNGIAQEMIEYCDKAIERLKFGQSNGLWLSTITYSASDKTQLSILKSCLISEIARPSVNILPYVQFDYPKNHNQEILLPTNDAKNPLLVPINTSELSMLCTPPSKPVPDFEIKQNKMYPMVHSREPGVVIGNISDGYKPLDNMVFSLTENDLNKHTFVCGITGSGKTTTVKRILKTSEKPYLVIEAAKKEYRNIEGQERKNIYTLGKPEINCIKMNPFFVQRGINLQTHIDFLKDLFNASFSFYGPMPYILEKCLGNIYKNKGWNLTFGYHPYLINVSDLTNMFDAEIMKERYNLKSCEFLFPTMQDLKNEVKRYIEEELHYEGEVAGNIKSAILSRLESLCVGAKGFMFNTHKHINMDEIMQNKVVFELEGLPDDSDKAFCVGLLVIFINEYRQVMQELDKEVGLKHLLVIEEAHRLLKNIETDRASETMGNPKGKAVEHFTNMIAEMRSYGQGVIIAEQIPSKLAPEVIKNSSNKIVQRIVSYDDQALIANTMGIRKEDAIYLGNIKTGYALCHKEGMNLPVFIKVHQIKDGPTKDGDLLQGFEMEAKIREINKQLIVEKLDEYFNVTAMRLLNTLMIMDSKTVTKDIAEIKCEIDEILSYKEITLLPMSLDEKEQLYGDILAESVLGYLMQGLYSLGKPVPDEITNSIVELCKMGIPEIVYLVKSQLKKEYNRECKNHCIEIVYNEIKRELVKVGTKDISLEESIRSHFLTVSSDYVNVLLTNLKEGV